MLNDQVIVIRGDRIERFAASGEVQIPAGATTVDFDPRDSPAGTDRLPYAHHAHGY